MFCLALHKMFMLLGILLNHHKMIRVSFILIILLLKSRAHSGKHEAANIISMRFTETKIIPQVDIGH